MSRAVVSTVRDSEGQNQQPRGFGEEPTILLVFNAAFCLFVGFIRFAVTKGLKKIADISPDKGTAAVPSDCLASALIIAALKSSGADKALDTSGRIPCCLLRGDLGSKDGLPACSVPGALLTRVLLVEAAS